MSRPDADKPQSEALEFEQEFEQELTNVERSLQELKQRYTQVQQDQATQAHLQARQSDLKQQLKRRKSAEMQAELKCIETQLEALETNLESHLFTWGSLKEAFWQILRFGGLGIVIGWFLAFAVLQEPKPKAPTDAPATSTPSAP
ncbi:MAG: hypothetical protein NW224_22135 [Leptolyngbyaceae cyanobacterium bins.302]|nr:hypothetical protein [Leptolyngbyaceae cyanobacterium bins.302]